MGTCFAGSRSCEVNGIIGEYDVTHVAPVPHASSVSVSHLASVRPVFAKRPLRYREEKFSSVASQDPGSAVRCFSERFVRSFFLWNTCPAVMANFVPEFFLSHFETSYYNCTSKKIYKVKVTVIVN